MNKKYELVPSSSDESWGTSFWGSVYRIRALRDIPAFKVKQGDLGGYVNNADILTQDGDCWISPMAKVYGKVHISDNVYIGDQARVFNYVDDHALVVSGEAKVTGNAQVMMENGAESMCTVTENTHISGHAQVINTRIITGHAKIADQAKLKGVREVSGSSYISGRAVLHENVTVKGMASVFGNAILGAGVTVINQRVSGNMALVYQPEKTKDLGSWKHLKQKNSAYEEMISVYNDTLSSLKTSKKDAPSLSVEVKDALNLFAEIKFDLASYESDIVKLIKYPAMTDRSVPATLEMAVALKLANRLALNPTHTGFVASVLDLEKKFLTAESHALKVASSSLSEEGKKKAIRASDLLAIASNDASTEQEKKVAFKQAFKQLEGFIVVPEIAVDTFRIKIGLKELEG